MMRVLIIIILNSFCITLAAQEIQQSIGSIDSLLLDDRPKQALDFTEAALNKPISTADKQLLSIKKAEVLTALQQYEAAQVLLTEVSSQNMSGGVLAELKLAEGSLALYQGRNDLAEEDLIEALRLFENDNPTASLNQAKALTNLGLVYFNTGKYLQAEQHLIMALNIRQKLLPENHELLAASYNDLGLVISRTDPDKALNYYEKALPIYKKIHGDNHAKVAINLTNTALIYRTLELYGDALNNLESALVIWNTLNSKSSPSKAFVLFQLGYTHQQMKNNKDADVYYQQSLQQFTDSYGNQHPEIANVLNTIANLQVSNKSYDAAISNYSKAMEANCKHYKSNTNLLPRANDYYNGSYLLYSLMYQAEAFEAKYLGKTLKFSELNAALKNLMVCDTLIDKLRQQSNNEGDKISVGVIANQVYADGVRIASIASELAFNNRKNYKALAFYFAEKSKSAVLLEAISDVSAKSFAGIPNELLEEEKQLKSAIALCAQKLSQKPTAEEEVYLRETVFTLNRQYQFFTEQLEKNYPDYYNLKFNTATPSIRELQKLTNTNTALLSYFIDDSQSQNGDNVRLYIFTITGSRLTITSRLLPKLFDKYVTGFRNAIYYNEQKTLDIIGHQLYELLIPALSGSIKKIVVFPTGRLGVIPFEALVTKKPTKRIINPSYLVQKYAVSYSFSASLALQKSNVPLVDSSSILLCAPVTFLEKDKLAELPGTKEEVKNIATIFENTNNNQKTILYADANEALIKSNTLKDFSFLHFATHGIVDEVNPELSRIFLQPDSHSEDGYLFSSEIYNLKLNANLVTLSACQTGLGKIAKGEGVIGLSRALVYAGAKNIIVSYWSVADQSTSELMTNFYDKVLNKNSNFAESLKAVKIDMIKSSTYNAPYYWAPFVLIGF